MTPSITVTITVNTPVKNAWKLWTTPADIMKWNIPFPDWHNLLVEVDLKEEGHFLFRMQAKDGSQGFDYAGKYDQVITHKLIELTTSDGRKAANTFTANGNNTIITETFEPETKTPAYIQKGFCQSVLNNFKKYAELQLDQRVAVK